MFNSSSPFGQSSSSPFGSPSIFGQTNNANNNNPFAPKPFGTTSPFGAQTGGSIFGGTSTGVFGGTPSSSPLSSAPVFGASSSPAFGSSTPAFGASSSPAFGNSSSSFGNSSVPGQTPAFGGFGSGNMQSSPFGGSFQQSQPAFGSNLFGSSTPFSAPSQPAFGASSTPAFGATTTPAFGGTSTPAFGATTTPAFGGTNTPAFGATNTPAFAASSTPAFGGSASTPFGSTANAFGISGSPVFGSTPAFGASSASMFGSSSTPTYGTSSTPAFGTSSTPAFGTSSTPAFGASSIPSFGFGSTPSFGQSAPTFHGSSPFGTTTSPFGTQSSPFGTQATTPTFGSSGFGQPSPGGQRGGSRIASYTPATEVDSGTQPAGKLDSISAMPVYKDKSHEELRWEDYQQGDKGGAAPGGQAPGAIGFGVSNTQSNAFAASSTFGQTSANPFSSSTSSNLFAPKAAAFGSSGFGSSSTPAFGSSPFGLSSTSNLFGQTSSAAPSIFGSTPAFGAGTSPSIFGSSSSSGFGTSTSIFGSAAVQGSTPAFGSALSFGNTQPATQFQSNAPSLGQTSLPFGQSAPFGQSGLFNTPATGFGGNLFTSTPSLPSNTVGFGQTTPTLSTPFQSAQPSQTTSAFGFSNFGQTQPVAGTNNFGSTSSMFGQSLFGQSSATQNSVPVQQASFTNPFGTLPAMPQMSIGQGVASSSIQYGISSLPVIDKPAPVKISSLLTSRHLSQRRIRLPARKYHPKSDGPKVPFFINDDETISTPKADALFIPRENPRSLVIRPLEQWQTRVNVEKASHLIDAHENGKVAKTASTPNGSAIVNEDKNPVGNDLVKEQVLSVDANQKLNGLHYEHPQKDSSITLIGHRASGAAISYEHGANIESLMPQLRHSDYYTEPQIQELAAKERANPGFCRHVKDFVIGRHGCGSIKFLGETDVRGLDLESLVQFNSREVIVYMDETKKPPVGQGLNKPAEVTLLNIKCIDQKTGQHCTGGARVEKYKGMLIRKTEEQGAEFVSYNPVEGEWKFKVNHFSKYRLGSDDDEGEEDDYRDVHVAP